MCISSPLTSFFPGVNISLRSRVNVTAQPRSVLNQLCSSSHSTSTDGTVSVPVLPVPQAPSHSRPTSIRQQQRFKREQNRQVANVSVFQLLQAQRCPSSSSTAGEVDNFHQPSVLQTSNAVDASVFSPSISTCSGEVDNPVYQSVAASLPGSSFSGGSSQLVNSGVSATSDGLRCPVLYSSSSFIGTEAHSLHCGGPTSGPHAPLEDLNATRAARSVTHCFALGDSSYSDGGNHVQNVFPPEAMSTNDSLIVPGPCPSSSV